MPATKVNVYIVDDDDSVRRALARLLGAHGYATAVFASARQFIEEVDLEGSPGCAVLDLQMPEMDGIALQQALCSRIPVIILTGHADVEKAVQTLQAGAIDFLQKPVPDAQLLLAVDKACECALQQFAQARELRDMRQKVERLTPREREVLAWIVTGFRNKQVASQLGTVEKTIKVHRAHVMQKLEVDSLPALVRIADRMGMTAGPRA